MIPRFRARPGLALLVALLALPPVHAQRLGSINGTVRASAKGPLIEGARVVLLGTPFAVSTSRHGEFSFVGLVPGKYVIQASAIGFETLSSPIEVKPLETLQVEFEAEPQSFRLPELEVREKPNLPADFLRRSTSGGGRYYSRAEIERRNAPTLGDLLRTVPGLRVSCAFFPCRIQLARAPRTCPLAYWIDGVLADPGTVLLQPPRDLDGVEIYSGLAETPPELYRPNTCGALAVWTRTPPPYVKKDKKKPAPPEKTPPASKPDTAGLVG
jgi:hypothetical protein